MTTQTANITCHEKHFLPYCLFQLKLESVQRRTDKCVILQMKAAQFTNHTKDSDWENFAQRRTIARLWDLFKAYCGERAWKAIRDRD
jgi:hypothetical protein